MQNYKLTISYDGGNFRGWQKQGNTDNTLQGKFEAIASRLLAEFLRENGGGGAHSASVSVDVNGAGRTDAGVHALAQCANFKLPVEIPCKRVQDYFNKYLPESVRVTSVELVGERFHARLSATGKTYVYNVMTGDVFDVFLRKYAYFYKEYAAFSAAVNLDILAMRAAAELLCGTHDFAGFCTKVAKNKSSVRTVNSVSVDFNSEKSLLRISFNGNGFLYNQVRIMVGTLLEIGAGLRPVSSISEILSSKDRSLAGFTAPAHGLFLWSVDYGEG